MSAASSGEEEAKIAVHAPEASQDHQLGANPQTVLGLIFNAFEALTSVAPATRRPFGEPLRFPNG